MVVEQVGTELRFKNPASLLMVVLGFAFWGVGFLDLLGHKSAEPDVFGLYSWPFFILVILYGLTMSVWFALFFNSDLLMRVTERVRFIQSNMPLALISLAGLALALFLIFEWDRWSRLPGLQFAAFGLVVLSILILLFANWDTARTEQRWRAYVIYPLLVLVAVEVLLQVMARFGALPGALTIGGDFYPYERVYYNQAGLSNASANRYGWYLPDVKLDYSKKRILVVGGSYVQSLQTRPEQQFSVLLSRQVNAAEADPSSRVEVIPLGMPGFGLSPFLYEAPVTEVPRMLASQEMIVMFHLGDDFQSPVKEHNAIAYEVGDSNEVQVEPQDAGWRHDLTHYYLRGFLSIQLVESVRSNYLTPKVIDGLLRGNGGESRTSAVPGNELDFPRLVGSVTDTYSIREPGHAGIKTTDLQVFAGGNNFMFVQGGNEDRDKAILIADNLLRHAQEIARSTGTRIRLVTVPEFPDGFFVASSGKWEPVVGQFDFLLPERELIDIAAKYDIPILPMGQYMLADGLTPEQIRALYLPNAVGGLTPQGHEYFADAIYSCFYAETSHSICSK